MLRFDDAGHGVTFQKAEELNVALREHFAQYDSSWCSSEPQLSARI